MKLLPIAAIPLVLLALILGLVLMGSSSPTAQAGDFCSSTLQASTSTEDLDPEQLANAKTIVRVGRSRNVPPYGWVIAIAASMQESSLRNLSYGDRDSAGLFQMRPSMGWGSFEEVADPVYAATAFYGGEDVPPTNPGLLDIPDWQHMGVAEAAQAVERSAHPNAYEQWVDDATAAAQTVASEEIECPAPGEVDCRPSGLAVEAGLTLDAQRVVRCGVEQFDIANIGGLATGGHVSGSDHYTGRAVDLMIHDWQTVDGARFGDSVAAYFVTNAEPFGVTYVIWRGRIWSASDPEWRAYGHPDGRGDPTALHMDHVHISVSGNTTTTKETSS